MNVETKVTVSLTLEEAQEISNFLDFPEEYLKKHEGALPDAVEQLLVQLP